MIALKNIYKSFKDKPILDDVSLSLHPGEIVGLIGKNGAGKTTLMRLILGAEPPDRGSITVGSETIGYLPQQFNFEGQTVGEYLSSKLLSPYLSWKINVNLEKVELNDTTLSQVADNLSGGQKTRVGLAELLLTDPEPGILLLDEPTNNLDAKGLEWLRTFLRQFKGGVLLTSHDRAFLDDTVDRIIELDVGKVKNYGGNYKFYHEQKQAERQAQQEKYEQNRDERERLTKAITAQKEKGQRNQRYIKRSDNDKAQNDFFNNRVTRKFGQQTKAIEARLEQLETVEKPVDRKNYSINIEGSSNPRKLIIEVKGLTKTYESRPVLQDVSFAIYGSDRIWLSGPNGAGKSTLLKIIASRLNPDQGEVKLGTGVRLGYFSQELADLDWSSSGMNELLTTGAKPQDCYRQARSLHLTEADLKQPLAHLSRGQLAKVSFAKLLLQENHLLVLDEPTNHLEIETRQEIEAALSDFRGAILVASHDKYFLSALETTKELALKSPATN